MNNTNDFRFMQSHEHAVMLSSSFDVKGIEQSLISLQHSNKLIRHSKMNMLHNLSCLETRFRLLCRYIYCTAALTSFSDSVSYTTFFFGMAYWSIMSVRASSLLAKEKSQKKMLISRTAMLYYLYCIEWNIKV